MNIKARLAVSAAALVFCTGLTVPVFAMEAGPQPARVSALSVKAVSGQSVVSLPDGRVLQRTPLAVRSARLMPVPGSAVKLALWDEVEPTGAVHAKFTISLDGQTFSDVDETDNLIHLQYADFDPLKSVPMVPAALEGSGLTHVYLVQFVTTALDVFRDQIRAAGGTVYTFMPSNAYLVKLDAAALAKVQALPYVRWTGVYQPAYKLEQGILAAHFGKPGAVTGAAFGRESVGTTTTDAEFAAGGTAPFNIAVMERGLNQKQAVAQAVLAVGGVVEDMIPDGFLMRARLDKQQLAAILQMNEILAVDAWGPAEHDMDLIRQLGGAVFIQTTLGMTGQGVRGEVFDGNFLNTHRDFSGSPSVLNHGVVDGDMFHGTSTTGIVFGRGIANPLYVGMLPGAEQPIFGDYEHMTNRYTHTAQLVDAAGPYRAVFQSNSWGDPVISTYTTVSQQMDDILFQDDFTILNSQSNTGSTLSRPQAWAKNIVSVGGINHFNNLNWNDDRWSFGASQGLATDGRVKPDIASMYDSVRCPTNTSITAYADFSGTSAATPICAGHFGIMFQMWHQGIFSGFGNGTSVFSDRPHMTTAKALMINTARQWDMTIAGTDVFRQRQGWGHPDLANLYNMRSKMIIVNETDVLTALQTKQYKVEVAAGEPQLKVTMTYADPPGSPSASRARINMVTLKVIKPDGVTFYWGNNGMTSSAATAMFTATGGSASQVDTVQNVFVQSPTAGEWTIEVRAAELVQDARVETPGMDIDYALVVTGATAPVACAVDLNGDGQVDFADYLVFLNLYDAGDHSVDFNGDGFVDFSDYLLFLNMYDAGC